MNEINVMVVNSKGDGILMFAYVIGGLRQEKMIKRYKMSRQKEGKLYKDAERAAGA